MTSISSLSGNSSSSFNGTITGLASGLDTESIIAAMTASTLSKISGYDQQLTLTSWKMDAYRSVTTELLSFKDSFLSVTGSNNLATESAFSQKLLELIGDNSDKLSVSGNMDGLEDLTIESVVQLAANASATGSAQINDGSITTGEIDFLGGVTSLVVDQEMSITYGSDTYTITLPTTYEDKDGNNVVPTTVEEVVYMMQQEMKDIELSDGSGKTLSDVVTMQVTYDSDGEAEGFKMTATNETDLSQRLAVTMCTSGLRDVLGLGEYNSGFIGTNISDAGVDGITGPNTIDETVISEYQSMSDQLDGKTLTLNYNGTAYDIVIDYSKMTNENGEFTQNSFMEGLQSQIDSVLGKNRVNVEAFTNDDGNMQMSFTTMNQDGTVDTGSVLTLTGDSSLFGSTGALNVAYNASNEFDLDAPLSETNPELYQALIDTGLFGSWGYLSVGNLDYQDGTSVEATKVTIIDASEYAATLQLYDELLTQIKLAESADDVSSHERVVAAQEAFDEKLAEATVKDSDAYDQDVAFAIERIDMWNSGKDYEYELIAGYEAELAELDPSDPDYQTKVDDIQAEIDLCHLFLEEYDELIAGNEAKLDIAIENNATLSSYKQYITNAEEAVKDSIASELPDDFDLTMSYAKLEILEEQKNELQTEFEDALANMTMQDFIDGINEASSETNMVLSYDSVQNVMVMTSTIDGASGGSFEKTNGDQGLFGNSDVFTALFGTDTSYKEGQDAIIVVDYDGSGGADPVTVTRNTNDFNFGDLTVTVKEVFDDSSVKITGSVDTEAIVENVQAMVDAYNEMIDLIYGMTSEKPDSDYFPLTDDMKADMTAEEIELWETEAKKGLLFGDSTLIALANELRTVFFEYGNFDFSWEDIGITSSSDWTENGKMSLDTSKLEAALASNPSGVAAMFNDETGVTATFSTIIEKYAATTGSTKGSLIELAGHEDSPLSLLNNSLYTQQQTYESILTSLKEKLETEETRYQSQFTALEMYISQMNSQSAWLYSQFNS